MSWKRKITYGVIGYILLELVVGIGALIYVYVELH